MHKHAHGYKDTQMKIECNLRYFCIKKVAIEFARNTPEWSVMKRKNSGHICTESLNVTKWTYTLIPSSPSSHTLRIFDALLILMVVLFALRQSVSPTLQHTHTHSRAQVRPRGLHSIPDPFFNQCSSAGLAISCQWDSH